MGIYLKAKRREAEASRAKLVRSSAPKNLTPVKSKTAKYNITSPDTLLTAKKAKHEGFRLVKSLAAVCSHFASGLTKAKPMITAPVRTIVLNFKKYRILATAKGNRVKLRKTDKTRIDPRAPETEVKSKKAKHEGFKLVKLLAMTSSRFANSSE